MSDQKQRYPLDWPHGWKRTPDDARQRARFSTRSRSDHGWSYQKQISVAQAVNRLLSELDKMNKRGHDYRVPEYSIVISTNIKVRLDGLPYSSQHAPDDPGVAVYFTLDGKTHF